MGALAAALLGPARAACADDLGTVAPSDSVRLGLEWGVSSDYTNQIYYEQTFDSTAVTGRITSRDTRTRALGSVLARLALARGPFTLLAVEDAGAGPTAWREALDAGGQARLDDRVTLGLGGEFDARRDETFDPRREDRRAAGSGWLRWTSSDFQDGARLFGRIEGLRSAQGSLALFPDYDYRQVGLELDRFGLRGQGSLVYGYATRAFPDTASRDYREHDLSFDAGLWPGHGLRIESRGDVTRRVAWRDSAIGDRFVSGDGQLALWIGSRPAFEVGPQARLRVQRFDAPDPTFFDVWIYRYGVAARFLPDATRRYELRPEIELLRTPRFGGLPAGSNPNDLDAVADEEYDQLSLTGELESIAPRRWTWLTLETGHRHYAQDTDGPGNLSARSSFWYGDLEGFAERPLGPALRLRLIGGGRVELHRASADDLVSMDLALELRGRL